MSEGSRVCVGMRPFTVSRNMTSPLALAASAACFSALFVAVPAQAQDDAPLPGQAISQADPDAPPPPPTFEDEDPPSIEPDLPEQGDQIAFEAEQSNTITKPISSPLAAM